MKKAIVTGGSGFIGQYIISELLKKKFIVYNLDIINFDIKHKNYFFFKTDVRNLENCKLSFKNSYVFHCAAIAELSKANKDPIKTININTIATLKIIKKCQEENSKLIYISSSYADSDKSLFYGLSKKMCEKSIYYFNEIKLFRFTIARYGSLYGQGAQKWNLIERIISDSKRNKETVYNGSINDEREYINIMDAAEITVSLVEKKYDNKIFLISGNQRTSIRTIRNIIEENMNKKVKIKFLNKKNNLHYNYTPYDLNNKNLDIRKIIKDTSRDFNYEIAKIISKKFQY